MTKELFDEEVQNALTVLRNGGIILYPTDTVWGLGCDATNKEAVQKIFDLKKRNDNKSLIVLMADQREILHYVTAPDLAVFDFIQQQSRPTTIVYENAIGFADNLLADDGSVAIRIVNDDFCRHLIKRLKKPIVSTSANISNMATPATFAEVSDEIKSGVDYVVRWRQDDNRPVQPSQIIRWQNGAPMFIRS
jgi:L-threonylcarbamoyladenylate synthase